MVFARMFDLLALLFWAAILVYVVWVFARRGAQGRAPSAAPPKISVTIVVVLAVLALIASTLGASLVVIDAGEVGVVFNIISGTQKQTLAPGLQVVAPYVNQIYRYYDHGAGLHDEHPHSGGEGRGRRFALVAHHGGPAGGHRLHHPLRHRPGQGLDGAQQPARQLRADPGPPERSARSSACTSPRTTSPTSTAPSAARSRARSRRRSASGSRRRGCAC